MIKASNPKSKLAKDKIINPGNWSLRHVAPETRRCSPDISLKVSNREDISSVGCIESLSPNRNGRENLFKFLKAKLKEAEKVTTNDNKNELKQS
ncbi:hypothetical protein CAB17_18500 [Legionella sainthelensi]|uniref:Uncharacterized protein n=2 Tax=Legionella sainthelensi TaxID=28087 RepID=A0A2H5FQN0_9GAMM|nr:hypothetical protein CAB17_18500 [Legionella sainthelensi]